MAGITFVIFPMKEPLDTYTLLRFPRTRSGRRPRFEHREHHYRVGMGTAQTASERAFPRRPPSSVLLCLSNRFGGLRPEHAASLGQVQRQ
jgi:hypothetical protein